MGQLSDQLTGLRGDVTEMNHKLDLLTDQALDRRVNALEDGQRWLSRLVIGIVLTVLLGALISAALAAVG